MSPTLKKLVKRAALLAAVGIVLSQMLPSLADQLTPNPVVENATPSATPEVSPTPSDAPSSDATNPEEPRADITYLPSETPTVKAKVIEARNLFFKVPNSVQVDPRASSLRFTSVALGGAADVLVCVSSSKSNISVSPSAHVLTAGQGTRSLLISGAINDVLNSLSGGHGLTFQSGGRISGSVISFGVAAVTKPSVDAGLCADVQVTRSMAVNALGIDLNTVKTPVDLGKK
jgi:hypothetical protein